MIGYAIPTLRASILLLVATMLLSGARACVGAETSTETRDFTIKIDRKHAGSYRMTISRQNDGSLVMNGQADVKLSYLVYTYQYTYRGRETWKGDRLVELRSTTNDDGKHYEVSVSPENGALQVVVNGKARTTGPDVWTTTYWHLPPAQFRNQPVRLLDVDTGENIPAFLQYVGTQALVAAGQQQNCAHYRFTSDAKGKVQVDAWYDAQERLVRQESTENGHRYTLELTQIQR
jgi:hypothetical protein